MKNFIDPSLLADNATSIHKEDVVRYYTESELAALKESLADATVQNAQRNYLIEDIKDILKSGSENHIEQILQFVSTKKLEGLQGTKELTSFIKETTRAINTGHTTSYENVYVFADHDERRVGVYAVTGHLLYERAMRPEEFQQTIFSLPSKIL